MNHMRRYSLLMALILCLTALWGCAEKEPKPVEPDDTQQQQQQQQQQVVPELLSDAIICSDGETTLRFEHNAQGQWQWKDDPEFPLDTTYVEELAATIDEMLIAQPIETDKKPDDLGLDSQKKYVTVVDDKGRKVTWYLGDKTDSGCYYMCLAGDETGSISLSPAALSQQISRSIYDMMILPHLQPIAPENIRSVTITAGEKTVTTVPNSSGVWVVGISSVNEIAQPMVQAISRMQIDFCLDFKPTSGAAAICGLDPAQATMTVEFVNAAGVDYSLSLAIGTKLNDGYCVMFPDDTTIYSIKADVIEPILAFIQ
jgi:predicted small lipoprotein YifL